MHGLLVHVGFVVEKVAQGPVFLQLLRFSSTVNIPPLLRIYSCIVLGRGSWGISVNTVSDYRLDDRGSIPGRGKIFYLYRLCPHQL
jgi:hypothetical protein